MKSNDTVLVDQETLDAWPVDNEGSLAFTAHQQHNRTLKICLVGAVALAVIMAMAAWSAMARPPRVVIVRVDDVRGAELVKAPNAAFDIHSAEVRAALWTWATWRYRILKTSGKEDFAQSYYFMSSGLTTRYRIGDAQKVASIVSGMQPEQVVDVRTIAIPPMKRIQMADHVALTGQAQIELITSEIVNAPAVDKDTTRKHWRINLEFTVDPTSAAQVGIDDPRYQVLNPLGLKITGYYETREPDEN